MSKQCNRIAFVENRQMMKFEDERLAYIDHLIADIKEQLIERTIQREWETTKLTKDTAYIFYFRLNNATRQFLNEYSNSLFNWISPELPEDLMFYKNDKCMLALCSHERFFMVGKDVWNSIEKQGRN
ncbi:stage III sporulation protein AH [Bacillus niameyensis]|uniref:stage III sporulation protein AH n=1 Tax=Bacillus niameyensis TaxID=1522308 RepID=UPI001E3EA175|nr:stage III sporulation protein AH [Bacillus niameyensis]